MKDKLDPWIVYFFALTDYAPDEEFFDVMKRFSLVESHAKDLLSERIEVRQALALFARGLVERPSQIVTCLRKLPMEGLLFVMAKTHREETRMAVSEYITTLRNIKPLLRGTDLIAMGYRPGPHFHFHFGSLTATPRLDGRITTRGEARDLIAKLFPLPSGGEASLR